MLVIVAHYNYDVVAGNCIELLATYKKNNMPKSFIKIKPVKRYSEEHNTRVIVPNYVIEPSNENLSISNNSIASRREFLEKLVKEKTGRKMQKKATPIREAVVLLPDDDNEVNKKALILLTKKLNERFKIKAFQLHIHNDEGHFDEDGVGKYNYHAHLLFDWIDHDTGKSLKLTPEDMSEIQTITSEILSMERGVKGSKNMSLNHHEYRGYLAIKDNLEKKFKKELSERQQTSIRKEIIAERDGNKGRNKKQEEPGAEKTNKRKFRK